jgi:hypothetical protein
VKWPVGEWAHTKRKLLAATARQICPFGWVFFAGVGIWLLAQSVVRGISPVLVFGWIQPQSKAECALFIALWFRVGRMESAKAPIPQGTVFDHSSIAHW